MLDENDPYKRLGEAIVDSAIKDYVTSLKKIKTLKAKRIRLQEEKKSYVVPLNKKIKSVDEAINKNMDELTSIESFIQSDTYALITDRSPDTLLEKMRKEAEKYGC